MHNWVCEQCGIEFSSHIRFESHLRANSIEAFIETFEKIAKDEIAKGHFPNGEIMLAEQIIPRKQELVEQRRIQGGFKGDQTKRPITSSHKNVKEG